MPVRRIGNKYAIGSGKAIYDSKAKALRAYRGYLGHKYAQKSIGGNMETRLSFFVPINKFDEESRMVYGVATCSKLDNQNEIVDYEATKEALKDYSNWRNIREMHKPSAVGIAPILELRDNNQELFIGAKIVDDQAWTKVKEGVYKGFSIGGEVLDRKVEFQKESGKTINRVTKYMLNEISVVDRPANPACVFQTVKRDTSVKIVTISDDPLKEEASRVMEKALVYAKRVLSREELDKLPDESFGLIKTTLDGDVVVKTRDYPMVDRVHAVNMIRKSVGCDELTPQEKERIHQSALLVLGKKHNETECPYCIKVKLNGGVEVSKEIKKEGSIVITHEPEKKTVEVKDGGAADTKDLKPTADAVAEKPAEVSKPAVDISEKPAEEQKPHIVVDEEAEAGAAPAEDTNAKLDRLITLLESLLQTEGTEGEEVVPENEAPMNEDEDEETPKVDVQPVVEEESFKDKIIPPDECANATMKPAGEEDENEDEAVKGTKASKDAKIVKVLRQKQLQKTLAVLETLKKENLQLKEKLEKMAKQPLPRKEAVKDGKVEKVERFAEPRLEKSEVTFSEELKTDIAKAQELRAAGRDLNKEETAFCQRVAEKMLDAKFSKVK